MNYMKFLHIFSSGVNSYQVEVRGRDGGPKKSIFHLKLRGLVSGSEQGAQGAIKLL